MVKKLKYFAYGSNLHPIRLRERTSFCSYLFKASLPGYKLSFHKKSGDSSKCNALKTSKPENEVLGIVYEINEDEKSDLDTAEGLGCGYDEKEIFFDSSGDQIKVFTYLANNNYIDDSLSPFDWYKELVLEGAKYYHFPRAYIEEIMKIEFIEDQDLSRAEKNFKLLERIKNAPPFLKNAS